MKKVLPVQAYFLYSNLLTIHKKSLDLELVTLKCDLQIVLRGNNYSNCSQYSLTLLYCLRYNFFSISVSAWVSSHFIAVHSVQCKVYKCTVFSVQYTVYTYTVYYVQCTHTQCIVYSAHSCLDNPAIEVFSQSCLVTDGQLPSRILHGILLPPPFLFNLA